jgi:hypothetical protein
MTYRSRCFERRGGYTVVPISVDCVLLGAFALVRGIIGAMKLFRIAHTGR